jgi:hypothetical protein
MNANMGLQGIATAIIAVERPRTASLSLLLLFASLLIAQLIMLTHTEATMAFQHLPLGLAPVAALVGIFTLLNMPLRDPLLPNKDISPVFSTPTVDLRTPEDNLTPWQFMSVMWMAPLIQEGYKRQLDDKDVWDLPWEFKHSLLHHTFRELPGSVTRRVFVANGMDVVRTSCINLIRLAASKSSF